jgi:Tn3 transposase DDE domain-containing protein
MTSWPGSGRWWWCPAPARQPVHPDALLNLDGGVKHEMVAADNASCSDMVFGVFGMLCNRLSPRFKNLEDQRFWKAQMPGAEPTGGCGPLEALARNKVNVKKAITAWPDMLRVFGREGHPTPLGQAFAEYGASPRPCTCSPSSIRSTTPTAARCASSSPSRNPATSSLATSATARSVSRPQSSETE